MSHGFACGGAYWDRLMESEHELRWLQEVAGVPSADAELLMDHETLHRNGRIVPLAYTHALCCGSW